MSEREPISDDRLRYLCGENPWPAYNFESSAMASELLTAREEIKRLTIIIQSVRTCDDGGCLMCAVCSAAMCALVVEEKNDAI